VSLLGPIFAGAMRPLFSLRTHDARTFLRQAPSLFLVNVWALIARVRFSSLVHSSNFTNCLPPTFLNSPSPPPELSLFHHAFSGPASVPTPCRLTLPQSSDPLRTCPTSFFFLKLPPPSGAFPGTDVLPTFQFLGPTKNVDPPPMHPLSLTSPAKILVLIAFVS